MTADGAPTLDRLLRAARKCTGERYPGNWEAVGSKHLGGECECADGAPDTRDRLVEVALQPFRDRGPEWAAANYLDARTITLIVSDVVDALLDSGEVVAVNDEMALYQQAKTWAASKLREADRYREALEQIADRLPCHDCGRPHHCRCLKCDSVLTDPSVQRCDHQRQTMSGVTWADPGDGHAYNRMSPADVARRALDGEGPDDG